MTQSPVYIIVVAGGSGSRFGADIPKQYCMLRDMPVLCHTLNRLATALPEAHIITVVSSDMADYWRELSATYGTTSSEIVIGGKTRWQSVKNALDTISTSDPQAIVLVHDGARPLVDRDTILNVVSAVRPGTSIVPVVPVTDSLRLINPDQSSTAVNRSDYRAVVTPQGFTVSDLKEAYKLPYTPTFTDDASVMAAAGMTDTVLVDSLPSNIKITNPGDLALAAWLLTQGI